MSGDEQNNDKQNVENPDDNRPKEPANPSETDAGKGLLSHGSEGKSYPFSVPGEEENPESAEEAYQEAPEADDVLSALSEDDTLAATSQSMDSEETQPEDGSQEEVTSELLSSDNVVEEKTQEFSEELAQADKEASVQDDEIEAALDEGLFANEVLPEETIEPDITSDPNYKAEAEDVHGEPVSVDEGVEKVDDDVAPREPYIGAVGADTSHMTQSDINPESESPKHAFDMGEPEMSEKEYSENIKKKSGFGTILASIIIFFLLVGVVIGGGFFYIKLKFDAPGSQTQSLSHVIKPKQGLRVIAEDLEKKGIIEDRNIFMLGTYINGANKSLKAGEFEFAPNASMHDVLETISKGKVIQHKITLAEGLTSQQIVEIINDNPILTGDIEKLPAEGSLLPETYQFERGMTRQQIIQRMQKAQSDLIKKLWPGRDDNLGVVTPTDAIILASIVEKETGLSAERSRVAAVFNNRLLKNMRLQSDPTVIYGIVGGEGKLDRPIRRSDLDATTAYNTYRIEGLPPTPIANPGKASIEAVLKPARTNDLFFVADGTGGHAFATTLKEHNENVARWRKIEKGVDAPVLPAETTAQPVPEKAKEAIKKTKNQDVSKSGVIEKTTTLKNDQSSLGEKTVKSDLIKPAEKTEANKSDLQSKVKKAITESKETVSEKVNRIFVKPEEAPLPRSKPKSIVQDGLDKINVSPLPEQRVPQLQQVPKATQAPQVNVPQVVQPGSEPTPELEAVKPAPAPKPFNPFEN